MAGPKHNDTADRVEELLVADPREAEEVKRAFAADDEHPEARETLTPEELRRWAETGAWPESSD